MSELKTKPPEISFTLEIIRAATGEKEYVEMVGHIVAEETETIEGEK